MCFLLLVYDYCMVHRQYNVHICRSSTQTSLDELESALKGMKTFCDTCTKIEGEMFMTANVYCPQCDMKYCNRHHKVLTHDKSEIKA